MDKNHIEIIKRSLEKFMKHGIKSNTMDDIARHLGISKKTLYRYVTDKDDLVKQSLKYQAEEEQKDIDAICQLGYNAIEESIQISDYISKVLSTISPSVHYDLQKYHRETFENAFKERQLQVFECLVHNMKKGIEEGYYRESINVEIVIKLYLTMIPALFNGDLFPPDRFSFVQVNKEFFQYHTRGIATKKGLKYLDKKLKELE